MVSSTKQTARLRLRRQKNAGRKRKKLWSTKGTPVFPVHPEGYDPNAPDAKKRSAES
jgi:hypothetical protein